MIDRSMNRPALETGSSERPHFKLRNNRQAGPIRQVSAQDGAGGGRAHLTGGGQLRSFSTQDHQLQLLLVLRFAAVSHI